jgi:peptidoglycan/LPS O-acetylase OafA/YrhL
MNRTEYRNDIDGLRALAVVSVILFHSGYLPNGYLGVDIFFVISGFLITNIVYKESTQNKFSILRFYERRLRRIIPLLLFICAISLLLGIILMLPEDLENLSQSAIASNLSINNILMYITSGNYWATKNDYKPLMHTWSLGIEEQFYLIYPLIFFFLQGRKSKLSIHIITGLTVMSLLVFLTQHATASKFYLIQYRFFELSIGGIGAILAPNLNIANLNLSKYLLYTFVTFVIAILAIPVFLKSDLVILSMTFFTTAILIIGNNFFDKPCAYSFIFTNTVVTAIGRISFSLYMWHQVIFAFYRYSFIEEMDIYHWLPLITLIGILSTITYFLIEIPFRNKQFIRVKHVLIVTGGFFLTTTLLSFYIHAVSGAIKDYPELEISSDGKTFKHNLFSQNRNENIKYNDDVKLLETDFSSSNKKKVLVMGNSFGRDAANILSEYNADQNLEIRYFDITHMNDDASIQNVSIKNRIIHADCVFIGASKFLDQEFLNQIEKRYGVAFDLNKVWVFGVKDFGYGNGVHHYRYSRNINFRTYVTKMKHGVSETNNLLRSVWGDHFIDLIRPISDKEGNILVFTPDGKFISHDTLHLTKSGALFFSKILQNKLDQILKKQGDTSNLSGPL